MQLNGQNTKGCGGALKQKSQRPGHGIKDGKFQIQGDKEGCEAGTLGEGITSWEGEGRRERRPGYRVERRKAWVQRQENEGRREGGRLGTGEGGTIWLKAIGPRWALQEVFFLPPQ